MHCHHHVFSSHHHALPHRWLGTRSSVCWLSPRGRRAPRDWGYLGWMYHRYVWERGDVCVGRGGVRWGSAMGVWGGWDGCVWGGGMGVCGGVGWVYEGNGGCCTATHPAVLLPTLIICAYCIISSPVLLYILIPSTRCVLPSPLLSDAGWSPYGCTGCWYVVCVIVCFLLLCWCCGQQATPCTHTHTHSHPFPPSPTLSTPLTPSHPLLHSITPPHTRFDWSQWCRWITWPINDGVCVVACVVIYIWMMCDRCMWYPHKYTTHTHAHNTHTPSPPFPSHLNPPHLTPPSQTRSSTT